MRGFEGSCPGIGGCSGTAVAVMPDQSGNGYWLVTGAVASSPSATRPFTSFGTVIGGRGGRRRHPGRARLLDPLCQRFRSAFGDATPLGAPLGYVNSFNPASAIFPTADGRGYWVAAGAGDVFTYGDAPFLGSMSATGLNGQIIAAFGF